MLENTGSSAVIAGPDVAQTLSAKASHSRASHLVTLQRESAPYPPPINAGWDPRPLRPGHSASPPFLSCSK